MRLVAGFTLVDQGIIGLPGEPPLERVIVYALAIGAGILLLAGLWTPFAGALSAVIELWCAFSQPGDPLTHILLVTLGAGLALVGPGAWSVDARLFGWKRIDIRNRKS
jgi:putative oxidoreductase